MSNRLYLCAIFCVIFAANFANAEESHHHHNSDSYSSLNHNQNHSHALGELMLTYRYENMLMKGMRDGTNSVTPAEIVAAAGAYGYMMTPTRMTMDMHMLGAMYGISDDITLMGMAHYMDKNMDMLNRAGAQSRMNSKGLGDIVVSAMVKLHEDSASALQVNFGASLPTGSTDVKGARMGAYGNLPYAMQLGSGTYDPILGLTYSAQNADFAWGAEAQAKIRTGTNDEGYRLGDELTLAGWVSKKMSDNMAAILRLKGQDVGSINGADANTIGLRNMVSTAEPENYGGQTVSLGAGVSLFGGSGVLEGHKLALEYERPIYQNLDGVQMETQHKFMLAWQASF